MNTTLNAILKHKPCTEGWQKLLKHLGKTEADDEPLAILTILESNGLDDALWALRTVEGRDREFRLMAADFAESVLHFFEAEFPDDDRPRKAIEAARDYANGLITFEQLDNAAKAARDAAAGATELAAGNAAWTAFASAAGDNAAMGARNATWVALDAALDAAWDAAWDAARDAAVAARAARAARVAVRNKQIEILKRYCIPENVEA